MQNMWRQSRSRTPLFGGMSSKQIEQQKDSVLRTSGCSSTLNICSRFDFLSASSSLAACCNNKIMPFPHFSDELITVCRGVVSKPVAPPTTVSINNGKSNTKLYDKQLMLVKLTLNIAMNNNQNASAVRSKTPPTTSSLCFPWRLLFGFQCFVVVRQLTS